MAGLIPQSFIDDLLQRVDIVDVVDKRVQLRKTGKNYSALCPFHQEKSPSFSVEPDKQFYYCFGCGAGGNAVGFIMNYDSVDFPAAVESLAAEYGLDVPKEATTKAEQKRQSENSRLLELLEQASRYYQLQLRKHPGKQAVVDYLKERGLSGTIARDFLLGFAPPGWDNLLKTLGSTKADQQLLEKAGLVIPRDKSQADPDSEDKEPDAPADGYYDRFRNRVMFPIRNNRGQVIGFGGRVLGDDKPKYLNSPETPVFHKGRELYGLFEARRSKRKLSRVLIVEGYMDVIALAQAGIDNSVATLGTACNANHLSRLFRLVNDIIFCFDGDDAGRAAAWRALQVAIPLLEDGRQVSFLFLPEGEDPDSRVRAVGKDAFLQSLDNATPLADYLFATLGKDLDLADLADRARLVKQAQTILSQFPKGVYVQLLLNRLAELVGVTVDKLPAAPGVEADTSARDAPATVEPPPHLQDWSRGNSRSATTRPGRGPDPVPDNSWSLKAIALILARPVIALSIKQDLSGLSRLNDQDTDMLLQLIELVRKEPHIDSYEMLGYFYGSPVGNQLTQLLKNEQITPTEGMEKELQEIIDSRLSSISRQAEIDRSLDILRDRLQQESETR